MAYLCLMASMPSEKVEQIRTPADVSRLASRVAAASHFIVPAFPELREAMDVGAPLAAEMWHPLRGPIVHEVADVQRLTIRLAALATQMHKPGHPLHGDEWTRAEITKVADLFQHADIAGEAVVTMLDSTRTGKRR